MSVEFQTFFSEEYSWCVDVVVHGKNDSTVKLERWDAEDIVQNVFSYWLSHPDKFDETWAYNKMIQKRKDFLRDRARRTEREEEVREYERERLSTSEAKDPLSILMESELLLLIEENIMTTPKELNREILYEHFIMEKPLRDIQAGSWNQRRKVIERFRKKCVFKYGGGDEKPLVL